MYTKRHYELDKLHISNEMRQLDLKNRDFYDELTPDEKKKIQTAFPQAKSIKVSPCFAAPSISLFFTYKL